jgi:two-component system chemotaxis response regulator CheY
MDSDRLRILVVDDHAMLRQMIKTTLATYNVDQLDWASNGREALEKIREAARKNALYDIVFLDWNMPELNGFDVLSACRQNPDMNKMAVVMVTAEAEPDSIVKAMEAGATAYITKPFNSNMFIEKLQDLAVWKAKTKGAAARS